MNIYDFDHTIYNGDSSIDFFLFCLRRKPQILCTIPGFLITFIFYRMRIKSKEQLKSSFFKFIKYFKDIDYEINKFWNKNESKICSWYIDRKQPNDLIISASPEFLLQPIAEQLQVSVIGSKVDKHTGNFMGKNCYGEEKARRFQKFQIAEQVEKVYSDSKSDLPLFKLGKQAYLVNNKSGTIERYPKTDIF